jgi:hypothetical protein
MKDIKDVKDIKKATAIITIIEQVLRKQNGDALIDSYVNRFRVFNLFCRYGEFKMYRQRMLSKPKSASIYKRIGLTDIEAFKVEAIDKFDQPIVKEKDFELSYTHYKDIVVDLLELGLLRKKDIEYASINLETIKHITRLLNNWTIEEVSDENEM